MHQQSSSNELLPTRDIDDTSGLLSWYVIQSSNNQQKFAANYLKLLGYRVFYLRYREAETRGSFGRKVRVEQPLFGNYMFVLADMTDGTQFNEVKTCPGVARILGGSSPKRVPPNVALKLIALGEDGVVDRVQTIATLAKYARDEELLIIEGPFAGFVGKCMTSQGERLSLLLSIFGCENRVTMRSDQVRRATAPSELSGTSGAARRRMRKSVRQLQQEAGYDHIVKGSFAA